MLAAAATERNTDKNTDKKVTNRNEARHVNKKINTFKIERGYYIREKKYYLKTQHFNYDSFCHKRFFPSETIFSL